MSELFLALLNRSLAAGWLILALIVLRPFLRRVSRTLCCALWGLVAFRLLCPFSFRSVLSLIPRATQVPTNLIAPEESISAGAQVSGDLLTSALPPVESVTPAVISPTQTVLQIVVAMWITGIVLFALYAVLSYLRMYLYVRFSVRKDGYLVCDRIKAPFVLGVLRPRIYLPLSANPCDVPYILAHERAHLARRDHWRKPFAYVLLAIFWFQPLMWVAFILLCRDVEFACDERAIRTLGVDVQSKKAYAEALFRSTNRRTPAIACPLAFGGLQVKQRVSSVVKYRKPATMRILAAILVCCVVAVCFLTDPKVGAGAPADTFADAPVDAQEPLPSESENPSEESTAKPTVKKSMATLWHTRYEAAEVIVTPVDSCEVDSGNEACRQEAGKFTYCHKHLHTWYLSKEGDPSTVMLFANDGDEDGSLTYLLVEENVPYGSEIVTIFIPAGQKVAYDFGRRVGYIVIGASYGEASAQFPLRAYTGS